MSRVAARSVQHQIHNIFRCTSCGQENEYMSDQTVEGGKCACGGRLTFAGETYPGNADDWEEQRDPDGEWRSRRY